MNILKRFILRLKFRKSITTDQSKNVVEGMVKAQKLYRELCRVAHPDKHIKNKDVAEALMKRIVENRYNYQGLLLLKKEVAEKLI